MGNNETNERANADKNDKGLLQSISDSIKPIKEHIVDVGEFAYKLIVDNEISKDIPIVKWIANANGVRDKYQYLKIKRNAEAFIEHLSNGNQESLYEFIQETIQDEKFSDEFCTCVSEIIINGSRPIKSKILANLIKAIASGKLNRDWFETLSQVVEHASVPALRALSGFFVETGGAGHAKQSKHEALIISLGFGQRYGTLFRANDVGKALWLYGFREEQL